MQKKKIEKKKKTFALVLSDLQTPLYVNVKYH